MYEIKKENIIYFLTTGFIFVVLKFAYTFCSNDHLLVLLKPTNYCVSLITGSNSSYFYEHGFYLPLHHIYIGKSCSGFNIMMLSFLMLSFLFIQNTKDHLTKAISILVAFVGAYIFALFANTSRIFASIIVADFTPDNLTNYSHMLHESVGIITNLLFLIAMYLLTTKILQHYAKFAQS